MKSEYTPTIGLEIHAELNTRTKMFCDSKNDPDEKRPNVNICPVCLGHPGTLPVINKEAVKSVLKIGLAAGGQLADFTEFDRKNYFYPDIPKGYQISQYKFPLVSGGSINGIQLERIHLEEDTARSSHPVGKSGVAEDEAAFSLVDFNRAGVPLMELVTKPVIKSAGEAVSFAKELRLLLRYLGVAEANMEKGEMRVEANVSISRTGKLGTKVEVKNLNSFRVVGKAIQHEIERQTEILKTGGEVEQETRGFNEASGETFSQRAKESTHDYRYFPEPDLPKLYISRLPEFSEKKLKEEIPELPWERRERLQKMYGIKKEDAEIYVNDDSLLAVFENRAKLLSGNMEMLKTLSNYMVSFEASLREKLGGKNRMTDANFVDILGMINDGELSSIAGKEVMALSAETGESGRKIAEAKKLLQKSDANEIKKIAEEIISENDEIVRQIRAGKQGGIQYLVGQGMKKTGGSANPGLLTEAIKSILIPK